MWILTRDEVRLCHDHVPALFWPVLWVNLVWLNAVLWAAGLEGREQVLFYVRPTGRIRIGFMSDTPQQRAARHPLGEDFDRTPWTRLAPLSESALWARLGAGLAGWLVARLPIDSCDTAQTPLAYRPGIPLEPP